MHRFTALLFLTATTIAEGQIGGRHTYDFLQLPAHARLAGLGGVNVSLADRDVNFFHDNPALAGDTLNGTASAGYQFYVGDVGNALLTYAHQFPRRGQLVVGIHHTNYGALQGYDEFGDETHEYTAGETAVLIGRSHQIGHIRLGVSLKGVFSNIAGYRSNALLMDVGGIFAHPQEDFTVGMVFKNLGIVLSDYREGASSSIPFDLQAGASFKPEYMPVRFSLTGYQLLKRRLLFDNAVGVEPSLLKKIFSHINAGAEILLHRNVNVLVGYNYLLHQALRWETGNAVAGFSYGVSLMVKPVEFIFSRSAYTIGNAGYSFTLSTNTNQFLKQRKF